MRKNKLFKNIFKYQNLAITFWLISDVLWLMNLHNVAIGFAFVMLLSAVHIAYQSRKNNMQLSYNVILCYWFAANAIWMYGEFSSSNMLWLYAAVLYFAGLTVALANISFYLSKKGVHTISKTKEMYSNINVTINKAA